MRKNMIICDMSEAAIEVTIQNAQYYTPPVLQLKASTSDVELLLTDEQLFQLEQSIADYKNRIQAKGAATV